MVDAFGGLATRRDLKKVHGFGMLRADAGRRSLVTTYSAKATALAQTLPTKLRYPNEERIVDSPEKCQGTACRVGTHDTRKNTDIT